MENSAKSQKSMLSVTFFKDVDQVGWFWPPDLMFETSDWNDLRCTFVCKHTHTNHLFLFKLVFLMNKSWKDERLNVSVTGEELNRCSTHKNLMSAQPSGLSVSSTSLRQTTRLPNNCHYWSSGKTTEWAIMDQSDRYTVCVCVCVNALHSMSDNQNHLQQVL